MKCANCGARWIATPQEPIAAAPPEPAPAPEPVVEAVVEPAPAPLDDLEFIAPDPAPARRAARAKVVTGQTKSLPVVLGLAAFALVAVVALVLVFRAQVVRAWPGSGAAFASLGLPVSGAGLVIEGVKAEPLFQGGRPVLEVRGVIRNVLARPATVPALRINLLDKAGMSVAAKIARPIDNQIPAGATRHFAVVIVDPPATAHDMDVTFDGHAAKAVSTAVSQPAPEPAGPQPVDAKPLPSGAPDSLPDHG